MLLTAFNAPIKKNWTKFIIRLDITWVLASVLAVLVLFSSISLTGSVIILAVAAWVALMAYLQNKTLHRI